MRIGRRDLIVAGLAAAATWSAAALAQSAPAILGPAVWDWSAMPVKTTEVGALRDLVRQPTATLDELEMHVTTLNPGTTSHPPHTHPNEELVIIREGTVEVLNGGTWKRLGPGSVIFNASNSPHALRNVGSGPTTYHVINWKTPATPKR
ncbi:cupin domain-containing protein [Sphingomonas sp. G-3-2-10]|uniref:cupin domain-containing protein n=1 Tax=Sphingomonas sp. G-3-2-10 TaxID=2728838 RepID=UPI00146DD27A|nr:cupin domain-containing protein [Sphingomonas sp. G-3-2-10]NML07966.1 cupin domain-containing protein [Sphingomonas sp. G-3-2-10]